MTNKLNDNYYRNNTNYAFILKLIISKVQKIKNADILSRFSWNNNILFRKNRITQRNLGFWKKKSIFYFQISAWVQTSSNAICISILLNICILYIETWILHYCGLALYQKVHNLYKKNPFNYVLLFNRKTNNWICKLKLR